MSGWGSYQYSYGNLKGFVLFQVCVCGGGGWGRGWKILHGLKMCMFDLIQINFDNFQHCEHSNFFKLYETTIAVLPTGMKSYTCYDHDLKMCMCPFLHFYTFSAF